MNDGERDDDARPGARRPRRIRHGARAGGPPVREVIGQVAVPGVRRKPGNGQGWGGRRDGAGLRPAGPNTDLPVVGAVAEDERLSVIERHLGLMPCAELDDAQARVQAIGRIVGAQVDLARVRSIAASAPAWAAPLAPRAPRARESDLRIGIARDRAFGFYYPDDLAALRAAGAELVPIDTLADRELQAIDGLVIGGGFPEACMDALEANVALREALRTAIEGGLPTYAECAGLITSRAASAGRAAARTWRKWASSRRRIAFSQ